MERVKSRAGFEERIHPFFSGSSRLEDNRLLFSSRLYPHGFLGSFLVTVTSGLFIRALNLHADFCKAALDQFLLLVAQRRKRTDSLDATNVKDVHEINELTLRFIS